jgi:hypothetical protein
MSNRNLVSVFQELFSAPLEAATKAEADYRRIWADWLEWKYQLVKKDDDNFKDGVQWDSLLETAPVVDLDQVVEVGVTLRIASVTERNASGSLGIGVGPIHISGGFGFVNRTTQESLMQASTRVTITNNRKDLKQYLADHRIVITNPKELKTAFEGLRQSLKPANQG